MRKLAPRQMAQIDMAFVVSADRHLTLRLGVMWPCKESTICTFLRYESKIIEAQMKSCGLTVAK